MSLFFRHIGDFLFHTRNTIFPVYILFLVFFFRPVAMGETGSNFLLILGLLSIIIGLAIRVITIGLAYIIRGGRKRRIYAENLVTEGIFSHSRNPMYVGNIMLGIGVLSVSGNLAGLVIGSILTLGTYRLIVHSEECYLKDQFGVSYDDYCANVPRWLPKALGIQETIQNYEFKFDWPGVVVKEYGTLFLYSFIPLVLITWKLYLANTLNEYKLIIIGIAILIITAHAWARFLKKTERLISYRDPRYKHDS